MKLSKLLLKWQKKQAEICIKMPNQIKNTNTLFFLNNIMTIKHFINQINLNQQSIILPQGVSVHTPICQFLEDYKFPKQLELKINEKQTYILKNMASDYQQQLINKIISSPDSIYQYYHQYLSKIKQNTNNIQPNNINFFLYSFYMKLSLQSYCKIYNINQNTPITDFNLTQFIDYFNQQNTTNSSQQINKNLQLKYNALSNIKNIQLQIQSLQKYLYSKINIYKYGAILFMTSHILIITYFSFFSNFFSWDMIQPFIYSIGMAYILIGLRLYLKHIPSTKNPTLKQTLSRLVMSKQKFSTLSNLKKKQLQLMKQLQRIQRRIQIFKNRVDFKSSLSNSVNPTTTLLTPQFPRE